VLLFFVVVFPFVLRCFGFGLCGILGFAFYGLDGVALPFVLAFALSMVFFSAFGL
jgi:hypothetical protein